MRSNLIFLAIIGVIVYMSRGQLTGMFKEQKVPPGLFKEAGCKGKKVCGLVYLAPWCPACNSVIPQLQIYLKNSPNNNQAGLQIIVGAEQGPGDNARKAKEIGEGVVTDDYKVYETTLGISYFPSFFVVDDKIIIIHKDQEAINWMNESFSN